MRTVVRSASLRWTKRSFLQAAPLLSMLLAVGLLSACGGGSANSTNNPVSARVNISPTATAVDQGDTIQFSARVVGISNPAVTWSIQEGSAGGSISQTGLYTAPAAAMDVHVVATSVADPAKFTTALVAVNPVSVVMAPNSAVPRGRQRQFTALVAGTVVKDVTWTVVEGAAGGSITTDGVYTAPVGGGPFHVACRSVADPSKTATATVVLTDAGFRVLPTSTLVPRMFHTATLLPDGKVLIVGGNRCNANSCSGPQLSSAELFDPVTETFSATGSMSFARSGHTATLLNNGTVLVAGGGDPGDGSNADDYTTAEIYHPATGSFTRVGNMTQGRTQHSASLLGDGRVLLAGGSTDLNGFGLVPSNTAEIYDPAALTFSPAGNMPNAAALHTASMLLDGTVLVAGGYGDSCPGTRSGVSIFHPASNSFSLGPSLAKARAEHTATTMNDGRVLITGGTSADFCNFSGGDSDTAVVFDPPSSAFSSEVRMREPRTGHSATLLKDGKVLVVGSSAELFDPATSTFSITGDPNVPRSDRRAIRLSDGRVLFTGSSALAEIYE